MAEQPKIVYDIVTAFSKGMDSGVAVEQLEKSQSAFSNNVTFRGDFATDRPPFRRVKLSDDIDSLLQQAFQQGLFQGAGSYKPDFSTEQLVCSIAGLQFVISPSSDSTLNSSGSEITIAGDFNPSTIAPVWMWQSERWMIFQDGSSIPIFYDGVTSRRSQTTVGVVGETAADFDVPPIGGTVDITLTAPYNGLLNSVLNLNEIDSSGNVRKTANYMVTKLNSISEIYTVTLKNIGDSAGDIQASGSQFVIQPSALGNVESVTSYSSAHFNSDGSFTKAKSVIVLSISVPANVNTSSQVSIGSFIWSVKSISRDRLTLTLQGQNKSLPPSPVIGDIVILQGSSLPNVVVGTLSSAFTAPAVGSSANANLDSAYTNGNNQIVFINNKQYLITASSVTPPAPSTTVTIQNLNDIAEIDPTTGNTFLKVLTGSLFYNLPELPIGRMGTYGMGRNWQSGQNGISYLAGDIVNGSSGSPAYSGRDAVLKVTENTYLAGGGLFSIPSSGDTITDLLFTSTMDKALGQGALQVFTNRNVFSCNAPVDRTTWQSLTNPIETQSLKGAGASSQWAVTNINSDILFRCPTGELRSMLLAQLNFNKWGNTPISHEMERVIVSEDDDFMNFCSAIEFDNRWLVTSNPVQGANGVFWQGMIALNFDSISSLQGKSASIYDGLWTGLNILQLVRFQSVERAFAFCVNTTTGLLEIWELLPTGSIHFDDGKIPIQWSFETPAFFLGVTTKYPATILKLENGEISIHDAIGEVNFKVQYKSDYDSCWNDWHSWSICSRQSNDDTVTNPQYRKPMSFGKPDITKCNVNTDMPSNYGDFFQVRVLIQGHCVVTKIRLMASLAPRTDFYPPICNAT